MVWKKRDDAGYETYVFNVSNFLLFIFAIPSVNQHFNIRNCSKLIPLVIMINPACLSLSNFQFFGFVLTGLLKTCLLFFVYAIFFSFFLSVMKRFWRQRGYDLLVNHLMRWKSGLWNTYSFITSLEYPFVSFLQIKFSLMTFKKCVLYCDVFCAKISVYCIAWAFFIH